MRAITCALLDVVSLTSVCAANELRFTEPTHLSRPLLVRGPEPDIQGPTSGARSTRVHDAAYRSPRGGPPEKQRREEAAEPGVRPRPRPAAPPLPDLRSIARRRALTPRDNRRRNAPRREHRYIEAQKKAFERLRDRSELAVRELDAELLTTGDQLRQKSTTLRALRTDLVAPSHAASAAFVEEKLRIEHRIDQLRGTAERFGSNCPGSPKRPRNGDFCWLRKETCPLIG